MSEIKKNIETCRGEDVLAEVSAVPQDPHFGSLVNEAFDPLKQQALHQAGYDGYSEVIAQHKPYTFASFIVQMKSNLLLLLRALWQFPFGTGTLRSLADAASLRSLSDMWQHYIDRLSGNETYGIPSRLSDLTDLPSAPLLVADRKISEPNAPADGISLANITCSDARQITKIEDTNIGWTMTRNNLGIFTEAEHIIVRAKELIGNIRFTNSKLRILELPDTEVIDDRTSDNLFSNGLINSVSTIEQVLIPKVYSIKHRTSDNAARFIANSNVLWKVVFGPISVYETTYPIGFIYGVPNLVHLEFGQCMSVSMNLSNWNPTNALDASLDTLVTDEECHNNLEQFLKNFRAYIALRLATYTGSGNRPVLTLSQAVRDAIMDASHPFVFPEGTMTIYDYIDLYKHWNITI